MRLRYYREKDQSHVRCCCKSDHVAEQGVSLLACLLMDDGGLGHENSAQWIEKGMAMIDGVRIGKSSSCSWDRETWGADITAGGVTIYSLHDDSWAEEISLSSFREALSTWREFLLEDETCLGSTREIDLKETSGT